MFSDDMRTKYLTLFALENSELGTRNVGQDVEYDYLERGRVYTTLPNTRRAISKVPIKRENQVIIHLLACS